MVVTKDGQMATTMTMLDTPAETETSPAMITASIQETRSISGWSTGALVGNTNAKYDHTTWRELPDLYCALHVAVALVESDTSGETAEASEDTLIRSLVRSAEARLVKNKAIERETSWWPEIAGGKTVIGGFAKHKYAVEVEAVEIPKPIVESEKNVNGKSRHSEPCCLAEIKSILSPSLQAKDPYLLLLLPWNKISPTKRRGSRQMPRPQLRHSSWPRWLLSRKASRLLLIATRPSWEATPAPPRLLCWD